MREEFQRERNRSGCDGMGWDDGAGGARAEDRGGGGDLNAASRQTDRPRIRFPFPPIGSRRGERRARAMEREEGGS